jgi:hypothetical protein
MINKIQRFIFITSVLVIGLCFLLLIIWRLFYAENKKWPFGTLLEYLLLITPFASIGTLFGTLKDNQSARQKVTIIGLSGLSVVFLLFILWGLAFTIQID